MCESPAASPLAAALKGEGQPVGVRRCRQRDERRAEEQLDSHSNSNKTHHRATEDSGSGTFLGERQHLAPNEAEIFQPRANGVRFAHEGQKA
jgi:hypothetical protein